MASDLHTYRLECEQCGSMFCAIIRLQGEMHQKCPRCKFMNHFTFAFLAGRQYINGERAKRFEAQEA